MCCATAWRANRCSGSKSCLPTGGCSICCARCARTTPGYDLKQLFIGAEGTLGIVTAVALKLFPKPAVRCTAFLAVPIAERGSRVAGPLAGAPRAAWSSAFEIMPRIGLEFVLAHIPEHARSAWRAVALVCAGRSFRRGRDLGSRVRGPRWNALSRRMASDAVIASNEAQRAALWRLRESMSEAQKKEGPSTQARRVSADRRDRRNSSSRRARGRDAAMPRARPVPFGHLGDGNIHFNFNAPKIAIDMAIPGPLGRDRAHRARHRA